MKKTGGVSRSNCMLRRLGRSSWKWQRLALAVLAAFLAAVAPAYPATKDDQAGTVPTKQEINSVLKELSSITGFHIRKELPFALITRDQVNVYLKEQIRQSVKPDEIAAEQATLKKFGFVPAYFDLKQNTIDLLTEQAAAFYDYHRRKLFISDWATENMRDVALIHELGHALADQNFSIGKFLGKASDDGDASLAREAVVEGQASWLMVETGARRAGRSLADPGAARELLETASGSDDGGYPVFSNAPLYIRRTLLFPYEDGERFQQAVFLHDGQAGFARVFTQPPVSSAQIIHPDRYFAKTAPSDPELPKPIKGAKPYIAGSLSELETGILLEQYAGTKIAVQLAPKLKGANYRLDEIRRERRRMLIFASEWDGAAEAGQFFDAYRKVLRTKWKTVEVSAETGTRFAGKSDDGYFDVVREGARVVSREGFARPPQ